MDVVAAALQIRTCSVTMSVPISVVWYQGRPLLCSPSHLPTVHDDSLQDEDGEEAGSHDELWKGESGLFWDQQVRLVSLQFDKETN